MIPRSRPVINEADIAARARVPLATWRRRAAPAFRERVPSLLPGSRFLLYDLAQTEAYLAGRLDPRTARRRTPRGPPHRQGGRRHPPHHPLHRPGLRRLRPTSPPGTTLSPSTTLYGARLWTRREVHDRRDHAPGQGKGGGRRAG